MEQTDRMDGQQAAGARRATGVSLARRGAGEGRCRPPTSTINRGPPARQLKLRARTIMRTVPHALRLLLRRELLECVASRAVGVWVPVILTVEFRIF